jgi:hypothetical protein
MNVLPFLLRLAVVTSSVVSAAGENLRIGLALNPQIDPPNIGALATDGLNFGAPLKPKGIPEIMAALGSRAMGIVLYPWAVASWILDTPHLPRESQSPMVRYYLEMADAALVYYETAARNGHHSSQGLVADFYAKGCVCPKDLVRAYAWACIASAGGGALSMEKCKEIEKLLTKEQRDAGILLWSELSHEIMERKERLLEENSDRYRGFEAAFSGVLIRHSP